MAPSTVTTTVRLSSPSALSPSPGAEESNATGQPQSLVGPVLRRQTRTKRLTLLYVLSLSAIAGLSIAGQVFIQRSLRHQTMDIEVIQRTLEHRELVVKSLSSLREFRHLKETEERESAIADLDNQIDQLKTNWTNLQQLPVLRLSASSHRQKHFEEMVEQLSPTHTKLVAQLEASFDSAKRGGDSATSGELQSGRNQPPSRAGEGRSGPGAKPNPGPKNAKSGPPRRPGSQGPGQAQPPRGSRTGQALPSLPPLKRLEEQYMRETTESLEAYNQEIAANVARLKNLGLALLGVTLVVLVLEGALVFRPAVRQTEASLSALASSLEQTQRTASKLEDEQRKSEKLLLNVLPRSIAQRLKQKHQPIADAFDDVTVLFADIVGFTELSTQMEPAELVQLLNQVFSAFDALVERYSLEKIKTIGDAYMVVGGLPQPRADHAIAIVALALEMQRELLKINAATGHLLHLRIGINSGSVVAGVIGTKKFIYDLWGDTVNTASRMESHGVPGQIQVTEATWALVRDRYETQTRGKIQVKGKGETMTYWVLGEQQPLAALNCS